MNKAVGFGIVILSVLFISSCIIVGNSVKPDKFNICNDKSRVGGGFTITYLAPEDGTVHLMDRNSDKSILSQSITAGSEFKFSAAELDKDQYKKWGVNVDKADFVLFFYPKNPKPLPPAHFLPIQEGNPPLPPVAPQPPIPMPPQP
jgi:hypothetical protein